MSRVHTVRTTTAPPSPTPTRLRQIALVCHDIDHAKNVLTHVFGVESIYEDPAVAQWGLKNFLRGDIIEVVSPFQKGTTAGRLLEKRGEGGYMIIMQTLDAKKRRDDIVAGGRSRTIFEHIHGDVACIQYHPKGIKGGVIPELDSHTPNADNRDPLSNRFSPWHACGPDYHIYKHEMERSQHLTLEGCVLRLQPGDLDHEVAARQWEDTFGVVRSRDLLAFVNARLGFTTGRSGESEGLVSISIGVRGERNLKDILARASELGVLREGRLDMFGVKWCLSLTGLDTHQSRL